MIGTHTPTVQLPLIHVVESDDLYLEQLEDVLWFDLLRDLDWRPLREIAAKYYERLWQFNFRQAEARRQRDRLSAANPETWQQATLRLIFERATMDDEAAALCEPPACEPASIRVDPRQLAPGRTPPRWAGKSPKCFFALLKAFLGVGARGRPMEPEVVYEELRSNPCYARACGFTLPKPNGSYYASDMPSLRKLQQFDQIMSEAGLWGEAAVGQVARNLKQGRIKPESTLVHDTTHYEAFSSMQAVELPEAEATTPAGTGKTKKGKGSRRRKKSHPKTTKRCRCKNRENCPHPWQNADEGAGTVVKSGGKKYWAHKASTLGFPEQHILLDAVAMSDAASHDSESLIPHLERLWKLHPELRESVTRVLDDGAADDQTLKDFLHDEWQIQLLAPINPRNRRPIQDALPRGLDHITPTGTPVCRAGYPFEFVGCRHDTQHFLFRAPNDTQGTPVCPECSLRSGCYRGESGARQVAIPFERLPWIDPTFPQLSRRFAKVMAQRTAIERLHKLMKYDYGDERLSKRGNVAFQARLDKTLLVMHLILAHG
jgi:hypothetical protein